MPQLLQGSLDPLIRLLDSIQPPPDVHYSTPTQSLSEPPNRSQGLKKPDIKCQIVNLRKGTNFQVNLKVFELVARKVSERTLKTRVGRVGPVTDIAHQVLCGR